MTSSSKSTPSSSSTLNSSIIESKMFMSANGRLMSDVGMSSLQFLRTNAMQGLTSHVNSSSSLGLCGVIRGGSVFIHESFSGSHPMLDGST